MAVLECVKPGAQLGQIILAVDLTVAGAIDRTLATIQDLGYDPQIRHVNYSSGVHVLAILKDEQHSEAIDDDYLLEEWLQVRSQINPDAVHLWRGK
ncbi:MAG: hypothetical protein HC849_09875 [Oscillatoriales cyanobacterium RU_3_3]|nr:hypothetical protein [Microcoleus sp. SU_5_6]NJL69659.1 hypothetical protein [Microcoleus sp. SM1_3_4]NJM60430.1 hypothetical protein [Oscillatoriales cyanobacterium RU_3_3]NJR24632.1 hypothetical protein [Richelia sp. CSU_2_1]